MDEKQEIAGKVARPVFDVKRQTKPCRKKGSMRYYGIPKPKETK